MPRPSYGADQYIPGNLQGDFTTPLARTILAGGDAQAQAALARGAAMQGALGGVAQAAITGVQDYQQQKALSKQSQAFLNLFSDPSAPPGPKDFVRVLGPKGLDAAKAWQELQAQDKPPDPETVAIGFDALPEDVKAHAWPHVAPVMEKGHGLPGGSLPPTWDDNARAIVKAYAKARQKPAEPFTLRPGEVRYGPDGQQIASAPAEVKEPKKYPVTVAGPDGRPVQRLVTEEELAKGVPAYREPKAASEEPLTAIMGPDGNPVLVPRSQAVGKRPASQREQGRPLPAGSAQSIADLDTSLNNLRTLRGALEGAHSTGAVAQLGSMVPNVVTEVTGIGQDAKTKQAGINLVKQIIGKALEGGVLRKEDEEKYKAILPTIGDPPDVVKAKLDGLEKTLAMKRQTSIDAFGDAGYDMGKFEGGSTQTGAPAPGSLPKVTSQAQFDALPVGATFLDSKGNPHVKTAQ